jgi:uncharacterized protein YndB with AHSA1/START domain
MPEDHVGSGVTFGGKRISLSTVDALIERVQSLIDTRSTTEDAVEWNIRAASLGDMWAIGALATIAACNAEKQIVTVRVLDASPDRVYAAWTTPEVVKQWWAGDRGTVTSAEIDLRVGGEWRYTLVDEDGRRSDFQGEYVEIIPNDRIAWTEHPEDGHGESLSTVAFDEVDGCTRLTLLVEFASAEARDAVLGSGPETVLMGQMALLEQVASSVR